MNSDQSEMNQERPKSIFNRLKNKAEIVRGGKCVAEFWISFDHIFTEIRNK